MIDIVLVSGKLLVWIIAMSQRGDISIRLFPELMRMAETGIVYLTACLFRLVQNDPERNI